MSRELITETIRRVTQRYLKAGIESPYMINCGWCHNFACDVERELPNVELEVFSDDVFMAQDNEDFAQLNWPGELHVSRFGTWSIDYLDRYGYPDVPINEVKCLSPHVWIYYDGLHFDAEAPNGVHNWTLLPLFKILFGQYSKRKPYRKSFATLEDEEKLFLLNVGNRSDIPVLRDLARIEIGLGAEICFQHSFPYSAIVDNNLFDFSRPIVGRREVIKGVVYLESDCKGARNQKSRNYYLYIPQYLLIPEDEMDGSDKYNSSGFDPYALKVIRKWCDYNLFPVPSLKVSDALFIRRNNLYPKLIINEAGAYTTDTMHRVFLKEGTDLNALVASYYNSLSLAFTEVCGRSHGGGVLELMPNEAEQIPLPYHLDNGVLLPEIDRLIRSGANIDEVLRVTDRVILIERFGLSEDEIDTARSIWRKLSSRRLNRGK